MTVLALILAVAPTAVPVPEDRPSEPAPQASPPQPVTEPVSPPPPELREGELFGPPYGSRVGEKREGEVWRPIEPPTYVETQPVPSEEAVTDQGHSELSDALKKRAALPPLESKQRFALEVKFGPYLADVDRDWAGPGYGPYAKVFGQTDNDGNTTGQPKKSFYGGIAFEWQITKKLAGPIGIGVQWTMARDSAFAPLAEPPAEGFTRSRADKVKFTVMPLALQAIYRFELLADKVRWAPFVPYVKAGIAYAFWWTKNGDGKISVIKDGGGEVVDRGRGGVWGYQLNLGSMLRLDFLDPGTARRFDRVSGINHTYLFGEWQLTRLSNFGKKDSMNLGDSTWLVGLAMEF